MECFNTWQWRLSGMCIKGAYPIGLERMPARETAFQPVEYRPDILNPDH